MSKPIITIYNAETGEETIREMNKAEFDQYNKDQEDAEAYYAEIEAKANAKAALLHRLGITAEEAALLLG